MNTYMSGLLAGIVMAIAGMVLYFAFRDVDTPVVGLRQAGLVIAVLGVVDIVATLWSKRGSND